MRSALRFLTCWLCGVALGCGSRTALPVAAGATGDDGGGPLIDGSPADAASCGAPWVLFTLLSSPSDRGPATFRIYGRRADGTGGHALALPVPQVNYASVTTEGAELLYTDARVTNLYLYRFADQRNQLLPTKGRVGFGSLSPDGRQVVYGDGNDLFLVGVDGNPAQHLLVPATAAPGMAAGYPHFAHDGRTVIYAAGNVVQSIGLDGSGMQTLIAESAPPYTFPNPALSPDGTELAAVVSCDGASYPLRVYPVASLPGPCGAGRVVTTVDPRPTYYDVAWGPTGLLAFAGEGEGPRDVFVVDATGGSPTNLTSDLTGPMASASSPTWASGCTTLP